MARCPFAEWRPLDDDPTHEPLMSKHDGIVLHTMVGSLTGTDSMFKQDGYSGTESHFGVGFDGTIYQWVDTARTADANLEGTPRLLSIETADTGPGFPEWDGSDVPAWLPAQLDAIARIVAWAAETHDFPLTRMPDSLPSRRGVGYHRLGVDPYRVEGGEKWSSSYGKACPGDRRIAQVDEVIAKAKGGSKPDPWPSRGETSKRVGVMVAKLAANGYYLGEHRDKPDLFGPWTEGAIKRLQLAHEDTKGDPDGIIGPRTWAHILALPDKPPPEGDWFDMATEEDLETAVAKALTTTKFPIEGPRGESMQTLPTILHNMERQQDDDRALLVAIQASLDALTEQKG
jgi:hypothetical protein